MRNPHHRIRLLSALFVVAVAALLAVSSAARADVPNPGPRPGGNSPPPQPANNGTLFITTKEGASPAQLELPRAMTRRDNRRSDANGSAGRIRLAVIASAGTATLLLAGAMGLSRLGQLGGGRTLLVLVGTGISLAVGASVGFADLAVEPHEQPAKNAPAAGDGPTVVVRATEDAKGVSLVISPDVLRKAIADAEAAKDAEKK